MHPLSSMRESSGRPTSIDDYQARAALIFTETGISHGLAFQPQPSDVIISPYGKSGTTWLQQMVHTLRTRGDMDFDDISRVCPWIEMSHDLGLDLNASQKAVPRAYKSHLGYGDVPKGCRYIVSLRDPKDAMVSMYRFMEGWFFEPGSISITEFAEGDYLSDGRETDCWTHLASWWEQRDNPRVLLMSYEGMRADPVGAIRLVSDFIHCKLDDELLAITREHTSLEFMLRYKDRFDDKLMREHGENVAGLPVGGDSAKVRKGEVGAHRYELTTELGARLDQRWSEEIESRFGLRSYQKVVEFLQNR